MTYTFAIVGVGGGRPFTSNGCAEVPTRAGSDGGHNQQAITFLAFRVDRSGLSVTVGLRA